MSRLFVLVDTYNYLEHNLRFDALRSLGFDWDYCFNVIYSF